MNNINNISGWIPLEFYAVFLTCELLGACKRAVEGLQGSDAALNGDKGRYGASMVIRNNKGELLRVCRGVVEGLQGLALNGDKGKYGARMVIGNDKGKVVITVALSFKGKVPVDIALWCFKLNVDATLNGDKGRYGVGMVIRNDKGKIVITAALSSKGKVPVDIAEAVVVLEGIFMTEKFGLFPLCIEPNVLGIVRLCNGVIFWSGSPCYPILI
ncbi:hypothetical protein Q3G72_026210 [Acer saccharum]|nr:hypothetical protein Q3G72_026210 [Acer saccharum]